MEEPPKIERLLSSRGISLSNAANILKSYVSIIDHHSHHHPVDPSSSSSSSANNGGQEDTLKSQQQQQDIAEEKEEERLLARLNQLDPTSNTNNRLGGSISEDVYERLRMIMESVVAESEGRVVSAVGVYAKSKKGADGGNNNNEEGGEGEMMEGENDGQDEFMKELEEAERLETEYNQKVEEPKIEEDEPQQEQQEQQKIDYEQKKKDKKAKKAAKKAKKEAKKRKASSGGGDGANEEKRVKVEEDQ